MLYFLLPNVNMYVYKTIDCIFSDTCPEIFISNSLSNYLYEIKNKIKGFEQEWDFFKKYTNPYEFINTLIPGKNKCISKYKPLSRSYFKMVEILRFFFFDYHNMNVQNDCDLKIPPSTLLFPNKSAIRTFHLAEGPGGFIEAMVNLRKNRNDLYVGMTILDDSSVDHSHNDTNIPGWKKSDHFIRSNPNVRIETGADGTGNILSLENLIHCRELYGSSMDFITADGGFDFSADFNQQETNIASLLFAQMCYAICLQKQGGHFVLKLFDTFMEHTLDILYILSSVYKKVYITKPQTSRYANSEKYLVCKNFIFPNDVHMFPYIKAAFQKMIDKSYQKLHISRFLGNLNISTFFLYRIEEYNAIFGQQQIENIYQTIILIETKNKHVTRYIDGFIEQRNSITNPSKISGRSPEIFSDEQYRTTSESDGNGNTDINNSLVTTESVGSFFSKKQDHYKHKHMENNSKLENLTKIHIQKCIQWCVDHDVAYFYL